MKPTLRAAKTVLAHFGSFGEAMLRITRLDLEAFCLVTGRPAEDVYSDGMVGLVEPVSEFLELLARGGNKTTGTKGTADGPTMTHEAYFDHLEKLGTGWLGWDYDRTLDTPMDAIVRAYQGRGDMLRMIFGGAPEPDAPVGEPPAISQDSIMAIFRAHNAHPERAR